MVFESLVPTYETLPSERQIIQAYSPQGGFLKVRYLGFVNQSLFQSTSPLARRAGKAKEGERYLWSRSGVSCFRNIRLFS